MKFNKRLMIGILAVVMLFILGCSDNQQEIIEEEKSHYEDRINEMIASVNDEIEDLNNKMSEAAENEEEEMQERLESLKDLRDDLQAHLSDLRQASADEWDNVRDRINQIIADGENALDELVARK